MRAVNLIPAEERRARSAAGRSGGAVYGLLGAMLAVLAIVTMHAVTGRAIDERRTATEHARAEAEALRASVGELQAYTDFASVRAKRVETVRSLAASRFDWAAALREVARTVPGHTWLTGLRASVSKDVAVDGAATDPLRAAVEAPALEIQGCSTGQSAVALLVGDLRRIDGVQRVSLSSSVKEETSAASASAGAGSADGPRRVDPCARPGRPRFSLTVFFQTPAVPAGARPAAVTP